MRVIRKVPSDFPRLNGISSGAEYYVWCVYICSTHNLHHFCLVSFYSFRIWMYAHIYLLSVSKSVCALYICTALQNPFAKFSFAEMWCVHSHHMALAYCYQCTIRIHIVKIRIRAHWKRFVVSDEIRTDGKKSKSVCHSQCSCVHVCGYVYVALSRRMTMAKLLNLIYTHNTVDNDMATKWRL